MYIFLGIIVEVSTIIGSLVIFTNANYDSILEISNKGYRVTRKGFNVSRELENNKNNDSGLKKVLESILFLVPGVNLINAVIRKSILKRSIINELQTKEAIVPMTDKEKAKYSEMETKKQKMEYLAFLSQGDKDLKSAHRDQASKKYGLEDVYYRELPSLAYTLDEVKKLNEATIYSYRIGKVCGRNVAIIGVPDSNLPMNFLQFRTERYKVIYLYQKMSLEEAKDKTFEVYPFTLNNYDEVLDVVDKIRESRNNGLVKADSEIDGIHQEMAKEPDFQEETVIDKKSLTLTKAPSLRKK